MRRVLPFLALCLVGWNVVQAQIPDGSIAPDFTATDINGNTYHLYDLLDQGKTVYLDVFATWCGPCWNYHNTHALENLWNQYGPDGTDEAFVFAIEGDPTTNVACISGFSGCVGGTQGDWTAGSNYPIVDDAGIANAYQINYYPTIFCICPANKKVYECGQLPTTSLWNFRTSHCPPIAISMNIEEVRSVKCFGSSTGAINITPQGGTAPYTYTWSNGAHTQDLNNVPVGDYNCTITSANGLVGNFGPITVGGPPTALTVSVVESTPVGCNGVLGSITVQAQGGWPGAYDFAWSNGQSGETAIGLNAGNYTVSCTDEGGCIKTFVTTLPPAVNPTAAVVTPPTLTCTQPSIQLNGTNSTSGPDYAYQWFVSNGGHIVSGGTTLTPTIDAAGTYTLQVTNLNTTCAGYATTAVSANQTLPTANAGPAMSISCPSPTAVLQGTGSQGNNFNYLWIASNGGNISSGANTLTPTVNASGTYTLQVINSANGCSQTSATPVTGSNTPPSAAATGGTLSCVNTSVTLTSTTNAPSPTFAWTGPNGFTATVQNPAVTASGAYSLVITNPANNCTSTASASVVLNNTAPGASATGGTLTCSTNNVVLVGSSPDTSATFAWTGPNGFTSALPNPSTNVDGIYNLVVTAPSNGCTASTTATVGLNTTAPLASATVPGNLNCNTAQIQINGTNSSQGANIAYAWTTANGHIVSGDNTSTPLVDQAGTYNLLVSNTDNGCTQTTSATVNLNAPVSSGISAQTNVSCNGAQNGAATVTASGGNNIFSYLWSNGLTTATASGLAAGVYLVTVTDGENCTAAATTTISQPDVLAANASATPQTGNGANDGTATAAPTGGTSAYSYAWSNGATTQSINNLAPGTYHVVVTDANGCSSEQSVTVNAFNCALAAGITGTNASCAGSSNGSASVSLNNAIDPVTFSWSNGANTATASNLPAGSYTVNVVDGAGCPAALNILISEPLPLQSNASATDETAFNAQNGTAAANPTGGTSGYTYLWSNGETTQSIGNLAVGTYTVVITDANGCSSSQTVEVHAFSCALNTQVTSSNVSCAGAANGQATVITTAGTAPFTYAWSNGANTATASNLAGGVYEVAITDANGCPASQTVTIVEPSALELAVTGVTNVVCANDASGEITISIAGGTGTYSYAWSNGSSEQTASNLTAGAYSVVATDENGCTQMASATVAALDDIAPTVSVENAQASLGPDGIAEISLQMLNGQAADNCEVVSVVISPSEFDCDQLGPQEVTVTVTDGAGNASSATATINVVDDIAPVVSCPPSIQRCSYDNVVDYPAAVAVDNCLGAGGSWNLEAGLASGSSFPIGVTTQVYSYKDQSGNAGSCTFEVVIFTAVDLSVVGVTPDQNGQGVGTIDINAAGGTAPYIYKWYDANGQFIASTEDLTGLSAGVYHLFVTDANGCNYEIQGVEVYNVVGTAEPAWMNGLQLRPNPTTGLTQVVFRQVPDSEVSIQVVDASGRILVQQISDGQIAIPLDCSALPSGMYIVRMNTGNEAGVRRLVIQR